MQRPLDPLRFKQNHYDRPNQDWVCGHAAEGRACPLGPDARGNCRHTGECRPAKKGDRWMCMRTEASGGKCAEGPLPDGACAHPIPPCQPVPSVRRARGWLVWVLVALTTGALLILLGSGLRWPWVNPGALTNAHATSASKCSDCHAVEAKSQPSFAAFEDLNKRRLTDSALCLKCHALGNHPFEPHGMPGVNLIALQQRLKRPPNEKSHEPLLLKASHALNPIRADAGVLACMTCHQEHHGRRFNLKQLSDAQCQSCHSVQFTNLAKGHPDFGPYPYRARTRIFFDHVSHLQQHFKEQKEKAPTSCADCHALGASGRFMLVKSFAQTCAACHGAQIRGEGMTTKGVAFFSVPGIDAETLAEKGISIGEWPKFADAKLTPFMELLLDHQPAARAALGKLRGVDLLDLTKATPEQLAAAAQLAWGVKILLFHLVVDGQPYLLQEFKDEVAPAGLEMPRAPLLAAQKEWMPHLLDEVANYNRGIKPPLPKNARPTPAPTASPGQTPATGDESLLGGGDLSSATPTPKTSDSNEDLVAGGNDDLVAASPTPSATPASSEDLASGDLLNNAVAGPTPSPAATPAATPAVQMKPAEEWVAAGGWYRPVESFTLFYRPTGHADPFLVAWLTAAARLREAPGMPDAPKAFQRLTDPQNPGLCMKCHTITERAASAAIRWVPVESEPKAQTFTTFSHAAHLSLVGDAGCQKCHQLNPKAQYARYFTGPAGAEANRDPALFVSNFSPLSKMLCLQCHQPKVAGDACLLCHRYHTGPTAGGLVAKHSPTIFGVR
ncbi:MAG: hypothetical protein ACREIF_14595 [Chthoniobacterales bacterium]